MPGAVIVDHVGYGIVAMLTSYSVNDLIIH